MYFFFQLNLQKDNLRIMSLPRIFFLLKKTSKYRIANNVIYYGGWLIGVSIMVAD